VTLSPVDHIDMTTASPRSSAASASLVASSTFAQMSSWRKNCCWQAQNDLM